jgi:hypothetical protein
MNLKQRVFKLELQLKQRETTIEYVESGMIDER